MVKTAILIVDDEKNIRLTISHSLEPLEIPVQTAVNGEEALQKGVCVIFCKYAERSLCRRLVARNAF